MKKQAKKIIPYFLILIVIILVGFFGLAVKVNAQGVGNCTITNPDGTTPPTIVVTGVDEATCRGMPGFISWAASGTPGTTFTPSADQSEFQRQISDQLCWVGFRNGALSPTGCIVQFSYIIFYTIPAYLLWAAAQFFNVLIFITLGSGLLAGSTFISGGWTIVRDLSNLFFILILLYIAIKIILSLGGTDVKKMIANVVIMALLINFSMFMTQVVIDTSNILALIFYNRLTVTTVKNGQTVPITYKPILVGGGDKDVAGAMTAAFDPTSLLSATFFAKAGEQCSGIPGSPCIPGNPSAPILIGITVIAGALMFFAAYAFFVAGVSFVGRLIELWVLIIFSPFAFMSFTVPLLERVEYIGWDSWHKRLLKVSFMAPIFMFFMYFIFLLLQKGNPFGKIVTNNGGTINTILLVVIPALVILILLLKATEFAKKGSGKLGEFASTTGKIIGGLTVGAVTGGAALALRGTAGRAGAAVAESGLMKKWEAKGWGGGYARSAAKVIGSGSFDVRGAKIGGQTLASATGIPMGEAQKGGFTQARAEKVKKRRERAQQLEVGEDEKLKQHLNTMEDDLQGVLNANIGRIEKFDQDIRDAKEINDPAEIRRAIDAKKAFVNALSVNTIDSRGRAITATVGGPGGLKDNIFNKKSEIIEQNRKRKGNYANRITRYGFLSGKANREAAHKIRMETKIEDKPS